MFQGNDPGADGSRALVAFAIRRGCRCAALLVQTRRNSRAMTRCTRTDHTNRTGARFHSLASWRSSTVPDGLAALEAWKASTRDGLKNPVALFLWKCGQNAKSVKFEGNIIES